MDHITKNIIPSKDAAIAATQSLKEKEYWAGQLAGELEPCRFPGDYGKAGRYERLMDTVPFQVDDELCSRLLAVSKGSDPKLHMILAAGLAALLEKYTGIPDIIVVTPIDRQEAEGDMINTILPLRIRLEDAITFKELSMRVKDTINDAVENQNYPIEVLIYDDLGLTSENGFSLFNTAIVLENIQDKNYIEHIRCDTIFSFLRTAESIEGVVEYNTGQYSKEKIESIAAHFIHLLRQCIFNVDLPLKSFEIVAEAEKKQLLYGFNNNKTGFPRTKTVFHFFQEQTKKNPGQTAIACEDKKISYGQLNKEANQLAHCLRTHGIGADETVGIMMRRSPGMAASMLAVWKAGGAYIPIDARYPEQRVRDVLQDSGARVLLTESGCLPPGLASTFPGKSLTWEEFRQHPGSASADLDWQINMGSLAYVIYTSGSTGRPKGAMVEHMGMMNHMHAKITGLQLTGQTVLAQNASHTFDISVWQFFSALIGGGRTVIYPDEVVLAPDHFILQLVRHGVTVLEVVPSYLAVLLELWADRPARLAAMQYLLVTGEEIKPHLVRQWFEIFPGIKMVNAYGPTEASDDITQHLMDKAPARERIPIGKPVQNLDIYIVNKDMNLCPIGVDGEICVAGVGVGRGYLNDGEKTRQAFIPDPFTRENGRRLYKTGDVGHWLPDGTIEFSSRKDYQVKIRGYRIELGEIETAIIKHPEVKATVVIDKNDEKGNKYLCAYIVPDNPGFNPAVLKDFLIDKLPGYMIPAHFLPLAQIPLTPNGKIDKKALPDPGVDSGSRTIFLTADMLEKAGYTGNKPGSAQGLSTGEDIERFFQNCIKITQNEAAALEEYPGQMQKDKRKYYPLSHPQKMIYYSQKRYWETPCENLVYITRYPEVLDSKILEKAINLVLQKNEGLRLRIVEMEKDQAIIPGQYVSPYKEQRLDCFDFSGKDALSFQGWLDDISTGPIPMIDNDLFYFAYLKYNAQESGYYMGLHHTISDGWGINLLTQEIDKLYFSLKEKGTADHTPNLSYLGYIADEQAYLESPRAKESIKFWHRYLLPLPEPVDLSSNPGESPGIKGEIRVLPIPAELQAKIHENCRDNKISIFKLMLAALSIYVSRLTASDDFVIGSLNHNRNLDTYRLMAGVFISFFPLRIVVQPDMDFQCFVKELSEDVNFILKNHQEYPFDFLINELREKTGVNPSYFYNINLIGHETVEEKYGQLKHIFHCHVTTPLNIHVDLIKQAGGTTLELRWIYQFEGYSRQGIEEMHRGLVNILNDALAVPRKKLGKIELLAPGEKKRILYELNNKEIEFPANVPVLKHFISPLIYILSKQGIVQPPGVPGELWVGGDNVESLCQNHSLFDKEKWSGNPFVEGGMIYKTGHVARWLPGGASEFLGKIEHQVFIEGKRIDIKKTEDALLLHENIKEAVVVGKRGKGIRGLYAFIVSAENLMEPQLKSYLTKKLPARLIPQHFIQLEKMPLSADGKIDRQLLERMEIDLNLNYRPPRDEVERKLVGVWADLLGIEENKIEIDANFFELGGHSLSATTLVSRIHKEFNVKISLAEIFKSPVVMDLSAYIKSLAEDKYDAIKLVEKKDYYALSSAQKRLYIIQQIETESSAYNLPQAIVLEGPLEKERWEETLKKLIKRHESLRTSFHMVEYSPVQRIHDTVAFEIEYYDIPGVEVKVEREDGDTGGTKGLAPLPEGPAAALIRSFIRPFDLSRAPLLRVGLIKEKEDKYIFLVDMHHIISDGISHSILVKNFAALYEEKELPALKLQYRDYPGWQQSEVKIDTLKQQEKFWLKHLDGHLPVLNLPTDYVRPAIQSFAGTTSDFELGIEETKALNRLAKKQGTTLYIVLAASFNVLLARISNQDDIIIGTPVAGRRHADLEQIIGMFVNTLAVRNFPGSGKKFTDFLGEVNERTLSAFENQDYPFEELVEQVPVNRDVSRNPLFDVMFVLQNMDFSKIEIPGLKLSPYEHKGRVSKFDLGLSALEIEEKLLFKFEYCTKLFKPETIARFISYFKKLVAAILMAPGMKIFDIELVSEEEKHNILFDLNDTDAGYPQDKTIHELFADQVKRTPDNTAVRGVAHELPEPISVSYRTLHEKSNHLARLLQSKNVKTDTIVAIMMERSLEMIIGILGILKAGGVYLPIDPEYPQDRIDFMLNDSSTRVLLTAPGAEVEAKLEHLQRHEGLHLQFINMKKLSSLSPSSSASTSASASTSTSTSASASASASASTSTSASASASTSTSTSTGQARSLAYIIYTSGSTGKPKGVMIEHQGLVNYIWWAAKKYVGNETVNFPFYSSLSFDLTVTSLFTPLLTGNAIVIYREETKDFLIEKIIDDNNVGVIKLTPSHLKLIRDKKIDYNHYNIKRFIVGGEQLESSLARDISDKFKRNVAIYNEYGPTETVVGCMIYRFDPAKIYRDSVPIGKPVNNTQIYILDNRKHLQPVGIPGELAIAGVGVARGYLNKPGLTAEKFDHELWDALDYRDEKQKAQKVPGKNDSQPGSRAAVHYPITPRPYHPIYMTGDLARWLGDSNIEFLGRMDFQVKVRGFRIELGEIDNQLLNHEEISDAVVIDREDENGDKVLYAYVVPAKDRTLAVSELREFLSRRLPAHMIPSYFVQIEKIPLNPNGKVDREALSSYKTDAEPGVEYVAPGSEMELVIANIWKEVLKLDKVGIYDNFFDIGGHSLSIITVRSKLREALNIDIPIAQMFRYPTISSLEEYCNPGETRGLSAGTDERIDETVNLIDEATETLFADEVD